MIENIEYVTKISSNAELFHDKIISTSDGKTKLGPIEKLQKIKGVTKDDVTVVDINHTEIEKRVLLKMDTFFSLEMYRLAAKIAFEWYCLHNEVHEQHVEFNDLIEYITTGKGENPVSFISNTAVYDSFIQTFSFGSHILFSYIGTDGSVNIIVNLFGISAYNVRILDKEISCCKNNALFQELTVDAKRNQFFYESTELLASDFRNSFTELIMPNGLKINTPKNLSDSTLQYKLWYLTYYPIFQTELETIKEPNPAAIDLLKKQFEEILQSSALTIRGLKRFVKDHEYYLTQGTALTPSGTDKKSTFLYYCLFIIGHSSNVNTFDELCIYIKGKFPGTTLTIDEKTNQALLNEMLATENYFSLINKGAEAVKLWGYT